MIITQLRTAYALNRVRVRVRSLHAWVITSWQVYYIYSTQCTELLLESAAERVTANMKKLLLVVIFCYLEIANCLVQPIEGTIKISCIMLVTTYYTHSKPNQGTCNNIGDLRLVHNRGENFGAIQSCIEGYGWRYFSSYGAWTEGAARLACRQLHLDYLSKRL